MKRPEAVDENLAFLLAELDGQLARLAAYFAAPKGDTAARLVGRAGYSQNLSGLVSKACLAGMLRGKRSATRELHLTAVDTIARNLDLISRLGRRAVQHAEQIERRKLLRADTYVPPVEQVRQQVGGIMDALTTGDSAKAVTIGQAQADLATFHDQLFRTYTRDMQGSKHTDELAHGLLTLTEINRMGEALQVISEALLSINIGQAVKFERYFTLRSVLEGVSRDDDDIRLQPLAQTRSGSAISSVSVRDDNGRAMDAVFKDGDRRKVKEERVGVKSWNSVYPGLAPQILSYEKRGDSAALLIEHLDGQTFEDILLGGTEAQLAEAEKALHKTVRDIWQRTRTEAPAAMQAMGQLQKRMGDVYRLHPRFQKAAQSLSGFEVTGFDDLITAAAKRETALPAPFSVYIHGDFNLDNVIYDPGERKIRFIDLHRSRYMDYVQDVSVFMVSNYRLQVLDHSTRARIAHVACKMHSFAAGFARRQKDPTFEYRLALGLARSFASSARFVVDQTHATRMMLRARYILETALRVPQGKEARFKLPMRMLFRD